MEDLRNIRLSKSVIGPEEIAAVSGVLSREYLGMGHEVQLFEEHLKEYFGRNVCCVNTGTAALQLALQALGIGPGDEVLVQSLTYVATFQAISATGAIPIACEVMSETLTIDLDDAKSKLTSKTKALIPVHYSGGVGNLDNIYKFCRSHNLRVIEDASHSFGSFYKGKRIGSFGDVCCISLDGIKNITSGEGGIVITNDNEVIENISDTRLLGVQKDTLNRYMGQRSWDFDVASQGWRYHMSNIMAAIGIVQLQRFEQFKFKRQLYAKQYQRRLSGIVDLLNCDYSQVVPHIFIILVKPQKRDAYRKELQEKGIQTGIHYKPNHLLTYYSGNQDNSTLKKSELLFDRLISLPLHPDLSTSEVDYVIENVLSLVKS